METVRNNEKTIQRIKKLQALAERGVGGEKETANITELCKYIPLAHNTHKNRHLYVWF